MSTQWILKWFKELKKCSKVLERFFGFCKEKRKPKPFFVFKQRLSGSL